MTQRDESRLVDDTLSRRKLLVRAGGLTAAVLAGATITQRPAEAAAKDTGLTFWVISPFTGSKGAAIYKAADSYKAKTGVTINIEGTSPDSFEDKLITAVKGGNGPDIASVDSAWVAQMGASKILAPIGSKYAAIKNQFFDGPSKTGSYLGTQYAVPWYTNNVALWWNKKMFRDVGLHAAPTNWDQLVSYGQKLTTGDNYGLMLGAHDYGSYLWFPFAWQNNATLLSANGKKATFASPAGLQAWQYFSDLYLKYKIVPPQIKGVTGDWDQYWALFVQERVGMMMTGDFAIEPVRAANPKLQFGIAPLPRNKSAATVLGGFDLGITSTSKNKDEAWKFLEWFTAKPQEGVLESYSRVPARKDVINSGFATKSSLEKVFIKQSAVGRARATVPQWGQIESGTLADAWDAVIQESSSPSAALKAAAVKTDKLL